MYMFIQARMNEPLDGRDIYNLETMFSSEDWNS
jgi:hypothetical protein